jgi:two-component system cell cycle sensor histidine kinase PleC
LIEDMLDLARIEAGRVVLQLEPVVLEEKLRDCLRSAEVEAAGKAIAVELNSTCAGIVLRADRKALRRMIDNLLGNAVRYTPADGRIEVSYGRAEGGVRITVADSGPGIPPDEIPKVTKPFVRGRNVAKSTNGTGLGLAIVKSMVELHGGRIEISRAALGGAQVSLWLPLQPSELPEALPADIPIAATA